MTIIDSALLRHWESVADWGTIFVIVGVAGEGVEIIIKFLEPSLKKKQKWRHFFHKADPWINAIGGIFWIMVVLGLWAEFRGNHLAKVILDRDNAELHRQASSSEVQLAQLNQATLKLAAQYDLSTNALAEANARLASIRPIKERIINWFNATKPEILEQLKAANTMSCTLSGLPESQLFQLNALFSEPEAKAFLVSIKRKSDLRIVASGDGIYSVCDVDVVVTPALLK